MTLLDWTLLCYGGSHCCEEQKNPTLQNVQQDPWSLPLDANSIPQPQWNSQKCLQTLLVSLEEQNQPQMGDTVLQGDWEKSQTKKYIRTLLPLLSAFLQWEQ